MGLLSLPEARHRQLQRIRRRTWLLIALSLFVRGADAALGLGLIEPNDPLAAREVDSSPHYQEYRP